LKASEIKKAIAQNFGTRLKSDGYVYNASKNEFYSRKEEFTFLFNIVQTAWSDHYSLSVRLYISNKQVESTYESILGSSHKLTIGNSIERIAKSPDGREVINGNMAVLLLQDQDIDAAVETLERYYITIAKPYFEKYNSLTELDKLINNPPFDHCPAHVGGSFTNRCIKGLIVARLVDNPKFDEIVTIYDEVIKETMNSESIDKYYAVKEFLMYNRIK